MSLVCGLLFIWSSLLLHLPLCSIWGCFSWGDKKINGPDMLIHGNMGYCFISLREAFNLDSALFTGWG